MGRVLVLIQVGGLRLTGRLTPPRHPRADARGRRDKHTPCNLTDRLKTRSRGRAAPLNRLGRALPVFALDRVFIGMVVSGEGQLLLGICAMVSLLTVPIYSPSFQHVKVSVSSSFLSSTPMRQMMSSSIMSDMKY